MVMVPIYDMVPAVETMAETLASFAIIDWRSRSRFRTLRQANIFISDSKAQRTINFSHGKSALGSPPGRCLGVSIKVGTHNPRVSGGFYGVGRDGFPVFTYLASGEISRYCSLLSKKKNLLLGKELGSSFVG